MKKLYFYFFVFFSMASAQAQEEELKPVPSLVPMVEIEDDTLKYSIPEIYIGSNTKEDQYRQDMNILRNRIRRVYPYARATAENLMILNDNLEKLETNKQKRQYIKRSQKYLESQFKDKLKKLSRKDGKVLLKLIHRETGETTFTLIKEFRSGWTAFWSNTTAKTFSLDLKSEYHPDSDLQDFYLETQLQFLFYTYQLERSAGKEKINFNALRKMWEIKISEEEFFPLELRE
ncbi:hypothetical protein M2306_001214 [Myroides gitamensis]|uniref:DUF4294 domain-containing protein n=1 Tax=Myroides odoratus TaxID=256 RepID=UPI002167D043|nr:DUF4294 domain-containing protein [Myroides odoratus]MCS4238548.1 hypothetical protein [Myroides odoratus]MDH6600520.1 hypothetical protein [Myroides gitamensis]